MKRILLMLAFAWLTVTAHAQPGSPLPFGMNGTVRADYGTSVTLPTFGHFANTILPLPNGKFYTLAEIGGMAYIIRWNAAGTIDLSYGNNGYSDGVKINLPNAAIQADGKVIVGGFGNSPTTRFDFALSRFDQNGKLDPSFGEEGKVSTAMTPDFIDDWIYSIIIQPDGKILAGGFANGGFGGSANFAIARYLPNGSLDPGFGTGGKFIQSLSSGDDNIYTLLLQPDGKIIAVGSVTNADKDVAVMRLNANGTIDPGFNGTGSFILDLQLGEEAGPAILQPDGKLLLGGYSNNGTTNNAFLMRLNANGSLDNGFNGTGSAFLPFPGSSINNIQLAANGKIIGTGHQTLTASNQDLFSFQMLAGGTLDLTYQGVGFRHFPTPNNETQNLPQRTAWLQPDGKLVMMAHEYVNGNTNANGTQIILQRLNPDGSNDNGFGTAGKAAHFLVQGTTAFRAGIARLTDGKLVVAGTWNRSTTTTSNLDYIVARYLSDGSPDASFGTGGRVVEGFSLSNENANTMLVQPDGKILVAGNATVATNNTDFGIMRFLPNGSLDPGFGNGGKLTVTFNSTVEAVNAIALQPDGKIILAGNALFPGTGVDVAFARLNPDGSLDASFGTGGRTTRAISTSNGSDQVNDIKLQADGKIVITGVYSSGGTKAYVMRLNSNGSIDNSFNGNGMIAPNLNATNEASTGLLVQQDGKIVMGGNTIGNSALGTIAQLAVVRILSNGSLDNSFNGNGKKIFTINGRPGVATLLRQQADGKIILGGQQINLFQNSDFVFARLLPDGNLDPSFNGGGVILAPSDGDDGLRGMVIDLDNAYAAGSGSSPASIGVISAFSLGKLDVQSSLFITPAQQQYSDAVELKAVVSPGSMSNVQPATAVSFSIGSRLLGSANLVLNTQTGHLEASMMVQLSELGNSGSVSPGVKNVTANFTAHPAFNVPEATAQLTITREDALLSYSGNLYIKTPNVPNNGSASAIVSLRATVQDPADGQRGDIRRAKVRFFIDNGGSITPIVTPETDAQGWLPVQWLQQGDSSAGTAALLWPITLPANTLSESYTIGFEAGGPSGYYVRNNANDRVVVTVSRADMDFITGGGSLAPAMSAGSYAADQASILHFGFNAKYNRSGKQTQGKANFIFRRTVAGSLRTYQVKTTKLLSLGVHIVSSQAMGSFTGRAQLIDITDADHPQMVMNNLLLEVKASDLGEPGTDDELSIALYGNDGSLLFSSRWMNAGTQLQKIASGNIQVWQGTGNSSVTTARPNNIPNAEGMLNVRFNNPANRYFEIRFSSGSEESLQLQVTDVMGRVVERVENVQPNALIRLGSSYTNGIYFLRVSQGSEQQVFRLLKQ